MGIFKDDSMDCNWNSLFVFCVQNLILIVKEYDMKELVAQRVPPGDRWALLDDDNDVVYGALTDCLNQIFVVHQATQFFIDAKKGEVYIEDGVEKPQPIKKFSLYGD
jgi:hypothetical protein